MQEGIELRKLGITDENVIEKAIKLKDKNPGLTIRQAGNIMQFEGVTKSELIKPKLRERVKEHVTELVNGDRELANQIIVYLDQRFDLNTNKIEQSIAQEKENYETQPEGQRILLDNEEEREMDSQPDNREEKEPERKPQPDNREEKGTEKHKKKKGKREDRHPDRDVPANRPKDEEENKEEDSGNRFSNYRIQQNKGKEESKKHKKGHPDKEVYATSPNDKDKSSEKGTKKDKFKKPENKIHFSKNNNNEG